VMGIMQQSFAPETVDGVRYSDWSSRP
jgi:hypothetical protein